MATGYLQTRTHRSSTDRPIWRSRFLVWQLTLVTALLAGCAGTPKAKISFPSAAVQQELAALGPDRKQLAKDTQNANEKAAQLRQLEESLAGARAQAAAVGNILSGATGIHLNDRQISALNASASAAIPFMQTQVSGKRAEVAQAKQAVRADRAQYETDKAKLDNDPTFNEEYSEVTKYCDKVVRRMEGDSKAGAEAAFWLQIAGIVSGAVVAPALTARNAMANRGAIAAFSGLAGSTNLAQSTLGTTGLNGANSGTVRNQIASAVMKDMQAALDPTADPDVRLTALYRVQADCEFYQVIPPGAVPPVPTAKK